MLRTLKTKKGEKEMMEKDIKLERAYLTVKCLESAAVGWIMSTYVLFLLDRGLTPAQTTQVNTTFMLTNFFIDLPTGAIADILGQFPIYIIGLLIYGLGYIAYGFGTKLLHFHFMEGSAALGTSMMSEALEALVTNIIGVTEAKKIFSREGVLTRIAMIPTSLMGAIVASNFGLQYPWFLGGSTAILAFVVGYITLKKYHSKNRVREGKKVIEHLKEVTNTIVEGTKIIFSRRETRSVLLVSGMTALATQSANMFWAPILKEISNEAWWLGLFWVGISLSALLGAWASKKIKASPLTIGLITVSIGVPLALTTIFEKNGLWVSSMFLLHEIGRGALPIILYEYLNTYIPNEKRSTSNSARGSIDRLFRVLGLTIAGFLSARIDLLQTWLVSGNILIIVGTIIMTRKEK